MIRLLLLATTVAFAACGKTEAPDNVVFTLYTNAPSDPFFRTPIATFDYYVSKEFAQVDEALNNKRCNEAAAMFQAKWEKEVVGKSSDPGIKGVKHWCEKGRFRK